MNSLFLIQQYAVIIRRQYSWFYSAFFITKKSVCTLKRVLLVILHVCPVFEFPFHTYVNWDSIGCEKPGVLTAPEWHYGLKASGKQEPNMMIKYENRFVWLIVFSLEAALQASDSASQAALQNCIFKSFDLHAVEFVLCACVSPERVWKDWHELCMSFEMIRFSIFLLVDGVVTSL